MAKRYSIKPPSTGAGTANVIFAGGRGPTAKRPKAAPEASFSLDLNLEDMAKKRTARAQIEALTRAGYDPAILANMGQEGIAALHGKLADDHIVAAKEAKAADLTQEEGSALSKLLGMYEEGRREFPQEAPTEEVPVEEAAPPITDALVGPPNNIRDQSQTMADFMKGREDYVAGLTRFDDLSDPSTIDERTRELLKEQDRIESGAYAEAELARIQTDPTSIFFEGEEEPTQPPLTRARELIGMFGELDPVNQEKLFPEFLAAMTKFTEPLKEVDPWTHSTSMRVGDHHITYDKDGKELRKITLPKDNIEWVDMPVWKGDQQGSFLRDKDDPQNYIKGKDGKPKFFPLPKGFSRVRPRAEKSLSMKFNAFLETNDKYKHLVGDPKALKDPKVFYMSDDSTQQQAAIDFSQTKDGTVALLEAFTKLQKARNKGDSKRNKKIDDLIRQKEGR